MAHGQVLAQATVVNALPYYRALSHEYDQVWGSGLCHLLAKHSTLAENLANLALSTIESCTSLGWTFEFACNGAVLKGG